MLGKKRDTPYRVEALGKQHDKEGFTCGSGPLDHYLEVQAGQDTRKRVAATFVLCEGESNRVIGFYTLSAISVDIGAWPLPAPLSMILPSCWRMSLGNLDSASGGDILEIFEHLHTQGNTMIIVTHDAAVAARADRIIHIYDGKIKDGD